jgi:pilus assembly protein Flp/PilA
MEKLCNFLKDEEGGTAIEYGLIATLVAIALIVGATALGGSLNTTFTSIAGAMGTV